MLSALRTRWDDALHGLWLVPGAVTAAFAALALVLVRVDRWAGPAGVDVAFGGSAAAARVVLSTIAGSVITVAGLAFSITIVTLQLVSQQFSPRATRTFLGNKPTQVSAGVFLGVFVYCLVVLRAVREEEFGEFVPGLAVAVAILLGVLGIATLLFFINHTAQSIKVTSIAARIARETLSAIDVLYPEQYGEPADGESDDALVARWHGEAAPQLVAAARPGYVQRVDLDALVRSLQKHASRLHVLVVPGEFVTEEQPLASLWLRDPARPGKLEQHVRGAVVVANEREAKEDVGYGIQQLADIALRAISPSVNDPSTALTCVGYVAACLERLASRTFPATHRRYEDEDVEVVVRRPDFGDFVALGLEDVGRWSSSAPRVVMALLQTARRAADVAAGIGAADRVAALRVAAQGVAEPAIREARTARDRAAIEAALEDVTHAAPEHRR